MQTDSVLELLIAERDRLTRAIEALQGPAKRRGRPPKNLTVAAAPKAKSKAPARKKRTFTPAQRKAQASRMKAFWAAQRKAA